MPFPMKTPTPMGMKAKPFGKKPMPKKPARPVDPRAKRVKDFEKSHGSDAV